MAKHGPHSIEFKLQIAQELAGETLHGLANRHGLWRNLIRPWLQITRLAPLTRTPQLMGISRTTYYEDTGPAARPHCDRRSHRGHL